MASMKQSSILQGVAQKGRVLQVVSTTKTDTGAISTAGFSFTSTVSGLTVAITPSASSSKVLVSGVMHMSRSTNKPIASYRLMRDDTAIGVGDAGGGSQARLTSSMSAPGTNALGILSIPFEFLDTPATTSEITYGIQIYNLDDGTETLFINRMAGDSTSSFFTRTVSTITAKEVAG